MLKFRAKAVSLAVPLLLLACESGGDGDGLENSFEVPLFLRASVPDETRLSATVTINGRSMYRMQFDNVVTEASVELEGLAGESQSVSVVFQYLYGTQQVDIVRASRIYDPETDQGLVAFSQEDYQDWPDDDGDGVINLDEISQGTY